jgi:hypothetical protein
VALGGVIQIFCKYIKVIIIVMQTAVAYMTTASCGQTPVVRNLLTMDINLILCYFQERTTTSIERKLRIPQIQGGLIQRNVRRPASNTVKDVSYEEC